MDHFGRPLLPPPASGQHFGAQPAEGYQGSYAHDSDQFALSTAYDKVQRIMLNPYNNHRVSEKDLDDFRFILQMIMQECSRTNIESGKTWIFKNCHDVQEMEAIADLWLALSQSRTSFSERLHLIYLVNDVLFHSDRRQLGWMKDAILPRLVPLLRQAYHLTGITTDKQKVIKVISIWSDKHFFEPAVIDNIKESVLIPPPPPAPVTPHDVRPSPPPSAHPPMAPVVPMPPPHFNPGFRLPYPPPPPPTGYYPRPHVRPPPPMPPPGMHPHAPPRPPPPPKPPVYASRPPPPVVAVNSTHSSSTTVDHQPAQQEPVIEKPYHELPAGLMIPAIQQASVAYVSIHPSQIRMIPSHSSSELQKAVIDFYEGLDLKDNSGDFEEQADGKLDRGGWEPGYLDSHYEKLKRARSGNRRASGDGFRGDVRYIRNKRDYSQSRSRSPSYSPSRDRSHSYSPERDRSPERGRSPNRRYGGRRRRYYSSRSPSSRSRSSDSYTSSRSRSRSASRRSRSNSRSRYRYRSRSRSRSPSRGWHGVYTHNSRSARPAPHGGPGVLSDDTGGFMGQGHSRGAAEPYSQRACYNCSKPGHLARDCPESSYYRKRF